MEGEVPRVFPGERGDAADGELGGVLEAVDDDGAEARGEQLQHGVAADVARPSGDQHGPGRPRRPVRARRPVGRPIHRHRWGNSSPRVLAGVDLLGSERAERRRQGG